MDIQRQQGDLICLLLFFQKKQSRLKMDLREKGCSGMDWIHLGEDSDQWQALVNTVTKLQVPQNFGKFLSI
jgi:hypothetical protein